MDKRRFQFLSQLVLMVVLLCGCSSSQGNNLMADALPSNSALAMYAYNGNTGTCQYIYDRAVEEEILADIAKVNVKEVEEWSQDKVTYPIYGFRIGANGGKELEAAWSNGYWITMDGEVYTFDYDFESLLTNYEWEDCYTLKATTALPCARALSLSESGWVKEMLTPVEEKAAPENISMVLTGYEENKLTVEITNHGEEEWYYGEYFSVQVLLDGAWYRIPATPGIWEVIDIAYILSPGKTQDESYSLTMYGELPEGTYRLVVEGLTAEFHINSMEKP